MFTHWCLFFARRSTVGPYLPYPTVDPNFTPGLFPLIEVRVAEWLQRLQAAIKRARIDSVHRRLDFGEIICQLLTLVHAFGRQWRVGRYAGWCACHGRGVDACLRVHRPICPKLDMTKTPSEYVFMMTVSRSEWGEILTPGFDGGGSFGGRATPYGT